VLGYTVVLRFQIAQHNRDVKLLESLITYLGCGRVEINSKTSMAYFVVSKFNDINEKIIPFFEKYPIIGIKSLDFISFKNVAN
jgi:LAGLIDADG endonuclease